jgi:elongation factor Ts
MVTTEQIKELRDMTGVSVIQCKKALEEANGDKEKALDILRKKSKDIAAKKGDRVFGAGSVASYIHSNGTVGALVELVTETDFVANNQEFKALAREIAMHVAASNPSYVRTSEIPESEQTKAKELFAGEVEGKPEELKEKILSGKIGSYFKERVLLEQPYIKNPDVTVSGLIEQAIQKFGEKIDVGRIARFDVLG